MYLKRINQQKMTPMGKSKPSRGPGYNLWIQTQGGRGRSEVESFEKILPSLILVGSGLNEKLDIANAGEKRSIEKARDWLERCILKADSPQQSEKNLKHNMVRARQSSQRMQSPCLIIQNTRYSAITGSICSKEKSYRVISDSICINIFSRDTTTKAMILVMLTSCTPLKH
jgi:hypothetical protein